MKYDVGDTVRIIDCEVTRNNPLTNILINNTYTIKEARINYYKLDGIDNFLLTGRVLELVKPAISINDSDIFQIFANEHSK